MELWPYVIKRLWAQYFPCCNKLVRLSLSVTFALVPYLRARLEATAELDSIGRLQTLSVNIVTNTLAYYGAEILRAVRCLFEYFPV
jgi:hypothetical protein